MTNSVDPDQTAPIRFGTKLVTSILKIVSNVRQIFAADDFAAVLFLNQSICCGYSKEPLQ